jgi:PAS domain S-box-containing protein
VELTAAFDAAPVATVVLRERRVVYANDAALQLLAVGRDQILGHPAADFVAPEELARVNDRHARRARGEPAPSVYETTLRSGQTFRSVQLHVSMAGDSTVIQMLDVTGEAARRLRLTALAGFGATVQHEARHEEVYRAVHDALSTLGIEYLLFRPDGDALKLERANLEPARARGLEVALGGTLFGARRRWSPFDRKIWTDGVAYDDDLAAEALVGLAHEGAGREGQLLLGLTAIGLRIDVVGHADALLFAVAPWLRSADLPTFRLFGAQISGALDAALAIQALSRRNAELDALNRVAKAASESPDLESFLELASNEVRALVGCDMVGFFFLDREPRRATLIHLNGGDERAWGILGTIPLGDFGEGPDVEEIVRVWQLADWPRETAANTMMGQLGCATAATVPLRFRSTLRCSICVFFRQPRDQEACRIDLLQAMGVYFAAAIETHGLLGDLRGRVSELMLLNDIAAATASLDPGLLLDNAMRRISATFHGDAAGAFMLEGDYLIQKSSLGLPAETSGKVARLPLGVGLPGIAAAERRTLHMTELGRDDATRLWMTERDGIRSAVAVPLLVKDRVLGAFVLGRRQNVAFSEADLSLLSSIGVQLGVALENARLFEETRRRAEELELILEVGRSLVATLDVDRVLEAGIRNLARILDAPLGYVLLSDGGRQLVIRSYAGHHPELVGRAVPLTGAEPSVARRVFETREPVTIADADSDPRISHPLRAAIGGRAYLGLPLVGRDRAVGVALIVETRGVRHFTQAEVERATPIANQLAVALENARLYADLRQSYADLARAQDQLVRQERLAALGELAAIIAHEVRNPLGVIFNSMVSLRRTMKPAGEAKMLFDMVGEEADRLNRIVGDLLTFAKPSPAKLSPEPIARVAEEAVAAALSTVPGRVTMARDFQEGLPLVPMDAHLMRQAILNVALNAVQAMPEGGTLSVGVRLADRAAVIELGDTGPGIPDEVRHRIFEPFFTTRATGTGLGLAIVKRIVDDHHGRVEVGPGLKGGTVFRMSLPLAPADSEPTAERGGVLPRQRG